MKAEEEEVGRKGRAWHPNRFYHQPYELGPRPCPQHPAPDCRGVRVDCGEQVTGGQGEARPAGEGGVLAQRRQRGRGQPPEVAGGHSGLVQHPVLVGGGRGV